MDEGRGQGHQEGARAAQGAERDDRGARRHDDGEDPLAAAKREFEEETGVAVDETFAPLPPCRLRSGKTVLAWAVEADLDVARLRSNTFAIVWPPNSGATATFPEVDRYGWFDLGAAAEKINAGQRAWLDALASAARAAG